MSEPLMKVPDAQLEQARMIAPVADAIRLRLHVRIGGFAADKQGHAVSVRLWMCIDGDVERPAKRQWRDDLPAQLTGRRCRQLVDTIGQQRVQPRRMKSQSRCGQAFRGQGFFDFGENLREHGSNRRCVAATVTSNAYGESHR